MHQYVEKLNHFFPATEASMFHMKHPPPTRKTKTQNTTPTHNKKQPTFHVKQLNCCRNVVFHVKHREAFNHQKTRLQTQKISFTRKLIQRSQTWLVSVGKEDQAR